MTVSYSLTEIFKAVSVSRLILRLPTVEDSNAPSEIQRDVILIEGSPEGVEIGSPGDLRLQIDEPAQLWIKSTGERTTTGWVLIGSGGGGTTVCNLTPAPIVSGSAGSPGVLSTAARCDHEHPAPDIPTPSNADPEPLGVADPGVSLEYSRADHVHPESAPPATPPLDQVLVAGNTTGGTDVQFSNGDELQLSDGAINRGILDYLTNTIRLRTFTAAGALAGTLTADASASPFLTWTGPGLYVNNAQPALYLGNNGGQVFVLLRKSAGSVNSILFQAANITRTEITQLATSQDLIIAQRNGAGAETSRATYENATGQWTFPATIRAGNGAIAYPSDAGLAGQVITSAGDGTSSWQDVSSPTPSDADPLVDGVANPGVSAQYSRADHVHPTDTPFNPVLAEYEVDFSQQGNVTLSAGTHVIDGLTWTSTRPGTTGTDETLALVAGQGLRWTAPGTVVNTAFSAASRTATQLSIDWAQLFARLGGVDGRAQVLITLYITQFNASGNQPAISLAVATTGNPPIPSSGSTCAAARLANTGALRLLQVTDQGGGGFNYTDNTMNVLALLYQTGTAGAALAGTSVAGEWPSLPNVQQMVSGARQPMMDARSFLNIAFPTGGTTPNADFIIQRMRVRASSALGIN